MKIDELKCYKLEVSENELELIRSGLKMRRTDMSIDGIDGVQIDRMVCMIERVQQ